MDSYEEIFLPVSGYETYYEIGNFGTVRSKERTVIKSNGVKQPFAAKVIKPGIASNGYLTVALCAYGVCKTHCLHRLVAEQFIENANKLEIVNHIDGVKTNNYHTNLEWVDRSGNEQHAYRIGLKGLADKHHRWKGSVIATNISSGEKITFNSRMEITAAGFNLSNVSQVITGKRKTHKGYIFNRVNKEKSHVVV
ncbi:HNH endonuclease [Hafnia alvei]|uniref:NUMOD4 domain-containing protein n=1 Tax=Hafnia alvei TaxID=569 RepID=UPI000B6ADF1D|nr:NUMOD4 domain-containing protein [Hafnia alvei]MBI0276870.1 HNH endonuclease [Hafnia alvei]PNK99912.1 hypothetical protein CEQ28_021135 [Hafnia alvei]